MRNELKVFRPCNFTPVRYVGIISIFVLRLILISGDLMAQRSLFTPSKSTRRGLSSAQLTQLDKLRSARDTLNMELAAVDPSILRTDQEVLISAFGFQVAFETLELTEQSESDWIWTGKSSLGHAVFVVENNRLAGNISLSGLSVNVSPLSSNRVALRQIDHRTWVPELPTMSEFNFEALGTLDPPTYDAHVIEDGLIFTVVFFFTNAADTYVTGTLGQTITQFAQTALTESNLTYSNSEIGSGGTDMEAELAGAYVTNYDETHNDAAICSALNPPEAPPCNNSGVDLDRIEDKNDGHMDEVHGIRDKVGADVVILVSDVDDTGGLATLNANESSAFGQAKVQQATGASYATAHEMGHLFGAAHNQEELTNSGSSPAYPYGRGYGGPGADPSGRTWSTVMSYGNACSPACLMTIPYFSNPNVNYSGFATGDAATADNARVLNERKETVANFRHGTGPVAVAFEGIRLAEEEEKYAFGHEAVGSMGLTKEVTITNLGTTNFSVTSVSASSPDFTVLNFTPGVVPANGGTLEFDLRFEPKAVSLRNVKISIAHDSADATSPFSFYAIGRGADVAADIDPATPIPLPAHDGSTPGSLTSNLTSGLAGNIPLVIVNVDHDPTNVYWSDLVVEHPDGSQLALYNYADAPDTNDTFLEKTQFWDGAATAFSTGSSPFEGAFMPSAALSGFDGKAKAGTWKLKAQSWFLGDPHKGVSGWSLQFGPDASFIDVSSAHIFHAFVEKIFSRSITAGCGNGDYCPDSPVTRAEMAVFIEKAMRGSGFVPPAPTGVFGDVSVGYWAAAWIEKLSADGITAGCGGGNYCPGSNVTRAEMAVFLLKAKYGAGYTPPAPTGVFGDVPTGHWAAAWIEKLAADGVTAGCGGGNYCPDDPVTRGQMAVFLSKTFGY